MCIPNPNYNTIAPLWVLLVPALKDLLEIKIKMLLASN